MKTRLIRIGRSRGVRIPKPLIADEVELRIVSAGVVIETAQKPRFNWAAAAKILHERGEDGILTSQP